MNGENITARCFYVDTRAGVARCYRENEDGRKYFDPRINGIAREELRGRAEVRFCKIRRKALRA
jgi:hypothetical protein